MKKQVFQLQKYHWTVSILPDSSGVQKPVRETNAPMYFNTDRTEVLDEK